LSLLLDAALSNETDWVAEMHSRLSHVTPNAIVLMFSPFPFLWLALILLISSVISFRNLEGQIMDLANSHFIHLPVSPPPEDLAQIPSSLPSFLGDTSASR
jgi:hypothetical protein